MSKMWSAGAVLALLAASAAPAMADTTAIAGGPLAPADPSAFLSSLLPAGYATSFARWDDAADKVWVATAGSVGVTFLGAGYTNGFGVVDGASGGTYSQLFVAPSGFSTVSPPSPSADFDLNGVGDPSQFEFRFAINTNNRYPGLPGALYTSLNSDNIDGQDKMVTWKITGGALKGSYIIGFEDLSLPIDGWNDKDYEDMILFVSGAAPKAVPEPGTMALLGTGVLGLVAWNRRRKASLKA
jgi:hypothetical protein